MKKQTGFIIKYGDDTMTFYAVSAIEANEWIKAIKEVQSEAKNSDDTHKEIQGFAASNRDVNGQPIRHNRLS